jgi:hypothetical protein
VKHYVIIPWKFHGTMVPFRFHGIHIIKWNGTFHIGLMEVPWTANAQHWSKDPPWEGANMPGGLLLEGELICQFIR